MSSTGRCNCRSARGIWCRRTEQVRGREHWAFDERILGSSEFVEQVLAEQEQSSISGAETVDRAEASRILHELRREAAARCGTTPQEIASSSHRPAAVNGRTLICRLAVLELGMSSNEVAQLLGVTRQSVRRALGRSDPALDELGNDLGELLPLLLGSKKR